MTFVLYKKGDIVNALNLREPEFNNCVNYIVIDSFSNNEREILKYNSYTLISLSNGYMYENIKHWEHFFGNEWRVFKANNEKISWCEYIMSYYYYYWYC